MANTFPHRMVLMALVVTSCLLVALAGRPSGSSKGCPDVCTLECAIPGLCGADGKTYCNDCQACNAGTTVVKKVAGGTNCCSGCTDKYNPVCAVDGVTYDNECKAGAANAEVERPGVCFTTDPDVICTLEYDPVCDTKTNTTYGNACFATAAGVTDFTSGVCNDNGCVCPFIYAPVCGKNGVTYSNDCVAGCAGAAVRHTGECTKADCGCTNKGTPVCDTSSKKYPNLCSLRCAGQEVGTC